MIEGLKIRIPGTELKGLCIDRSAHHTVRAAVYAQQAENLQNAGIEAATNLSNGDPREPLKRKKQEHEADAAEMKFIADHIAEAEIYQLDAPDLAKLGITRRGW